MAQRSEREWLEGKGGLGKGLVSVFSSDVRVSSPAASNEHRRSMLYSVADRELVECWRVASTQWGFGGLCSSEILLTAWSRAPGAYMLSPRSGRQAETRCDKGGLSEH